MTTRTRRTGPFLVRALRECDREIQKALPRVLALADEEAVHDLRVGIRRMRVLLKLARPIFGRFHADAIRGAYTVVHRSTGELRDAEVLRETLHKFTANPSFAAWMTSRQKREATLRRAVIRGLTSGDLERARNLLLALIHLPIHPRRDPSLSKFATRIISRAQKKVTKHASSLSAEQARDPAYAAELHALRIEYKALRYATEILGPTLPVPDPVLAERAAKFQKRLGEIHDLDVAILVVQRTRMLTADNKAHVLDWLQNARVRSVEKYLTECANGTQTPSS